MLGCPLFNHLYKTNGETPQPYLRADIQELRQHPQSEARQRQQELQRLHQWLARPWCERWVLQAGNFTATKISANTISTLPMIR